jgi:hypothetical protein
MARRQSRSVEFSLVLAACLSLSPVLQFKALTMMMMFLARQMMQNLR